MRGARARPSTALHDQWRATMLPDNEIKGILQRAHTIAVVGLSDRPDRDSNGVARFLQRNGYRIIPVNPHLRRLVLGEQPYASLRDIREHVDIVDVFPRSAGRPWRGDGSLHGDRASPADAHGRERIVLRIEGRGLSDESQSLVLGP